MKTHLHTHACNTYMPTSAIHTYTLMQTPPHVLMYTIIHLHTQTPAHTHMLAHMHTHLWDGKDQLGILFCPALPCSVLDVPGREAWALAWPCRGMNKT